MLTRREVSESVDDHGWRLVLGALQACLEVSSPTEGLLVATQVLTAVPDAGPHLSVDVREQHLLLRLQAPDATMVTAVEVALALRIADVLSAAGRALSPRTGGAAPRRDVQALEIAVDAMDIAAVRPFWKAALAYTDEPGAGPLDALVDPMGQGPTVWFQQMDAPRRQRNRIHLDISVPAEAANERVAATLAVGGRLSSAAEAPAFWVLADAEGNEVCITTWQGRDPA